jgi:DNA-binding LacI/PurR family transcriptional regulator
MCNGTVQGKHNQYNPLAHAATTLWCRNWEDMPVSMYIKVRESITSDLRDGLWGAGQRLPALPDLAKRYGVSIATADRALGMLIAEGVLYRIPKRGTYVSERSVEEMLCTAPIAVAGIGVPSFTNDYAGIIISAFSEMVGKREWYFLDYDGIDSAAERLHGMGALLLLAMAPRPSVVPALEKLAGRGIRVLCTAASLDSKRIHSISVDNRQGILSALNYLSQLGHRRVAFIGTSTESFDTIERLSAFREGCLKFGLDTGTEYAICKDHKLGVQYLVDEAFGEWFGRPSAPTAIISGGNAVSGVILDALSARGISIPQDISVIGFDDSPLFAHLSVPLTVIRQPLAHMGRQAAQILTSPSAAEMPVNLRLPAELVVRMSCTSPRGV